jgi:hypothetical protein
MQLKAIVKNMAKEKKVAAQLVLQNYMLERFLERIVTYPRIERISSSKEAS